MAYMGFTQVSLLTIKKLEECGLQGDRKLAVKVAIKFATFGQVWAWWGGKIDILVC